MQAAFPSLTRSFVSQTVTEHLTPHRDGTVCQDRAVDETDGHNAHLPGTDCVVRETDKKMEGTGCGKSSSVVVWKTTQ